MSLHQKKPRPAWGTNPPEVRKARKAWCEDIASKLPPCDKCKVRRRALGSSNCTYCNSRENTWGHYAATAPPRLYDLRDETEMLQQIIRVNKTTLAPALDLCDSLITSAVADCCPLSWKAARIFKRFPEVGITGEDILVAFASAYAALYLETKWVRKVAKKQVVCCIKDDKNAKYTGANLVLNLRPFPVKEFRLLGQLRREVGNYILANVGVLVYTLAKTCVDVVNKRKEMEAKLSEVKLQVPD
jgi:hypothetical protein